MYNFCEIWLYISVKLSFKKATISEDNLKDKSTISTPKGKFAYFFLSKHSKYQNIRMIKNHLQNDSRKEIVLYKNKLPEKENLPGKKIEIYG